MLAPLDASVQPRSHDTYPLLSPTPDLSVAALFLPQKTAPDLLSSGVVCYQRAGIAPPVADIPLSPISPVWAAQPHSPPWSIADANLTYQSPPTLNCAPPTVFATKDASPSRASLTHSAGLYVSSNATGYLSPPAQCFPTYNRARPCDLPKAPDNKNPGSASDNSHTGLVSPPPSLIGQPRSTSAFRREGPDHLLVQARDSQGACPGITHPTPSVYTQSPSPTNSSPNSPGTAYFGNGNRRNSTPTSPRSGTTLHRRSSPRAPPHPLARTTSSSTVTSNLSPPYTVDNSSSSNGNKRDKKDKIRAYHREVGARNRQKEKEERLRVEFQSQWLEKVNVDLVAEEKSLATEKLVLVNELFRHCSQCGGHGDVDEYLALESMKIVKRAKSRFLKT